MEVKPLVVLTLVYQHGLLVNWLEIVREITLCGYSFEGRRLKNGRASDGRNQKTQEKGASFVTRHGVCQAEDTL